MPGNQFDPQDIVGTKYGQLTVTSFHHTEPYFSRKDGHLYRQDYIYECGCTCGKTFQTKRILLLMGHVKSCGCLKPKNRLRNKHPSWKGHGGISSTMWKYFQEQARVRDLAFDISIEQAWELMERQGHQCALSGVPIAFDLATSGISPGTTASLDRIDSSKGYTQDNIQWVHKDVNWIKGRLSQEEFIRLCRLVALKAEQ
jgi:hypothetical protein